MLDSDSFLPDFGNFAGQPLLDDDNFPPAFGNLIGQPLLDSDNFLPDFGNFAGQPLLGAGDIVAQVAFVLGKRVPCRQVFGRHRFGGLSGLLLRHASGLKGAVHF